MKLRTETDTRRYNAIDAAKFAAAICVIMIHIPPFGAAEEGSVFQTMNFWIQACLTRLAVPFFFISSGFFLYRKTTLASFELRPSKAYVARVFRLYMIWSAIYLPITLLEIIRGRGNLLREAAEYLRNVVFVGSYTHLWYLNALIVAVCVTSFLLYKKVKPCTIAGIAFAFYAIGLLGESWFGLLKPLREAAPAIWNALKLSAGVIVTTRNGLFFGFLFVSIGMVLAFYVPELSRRRAAALFAGSMLLMIAEVSLLESRGAPREHDMYLFLVPAAFFLFCLIREIRLPDQARYPLLRKMSALMFYTHLWVNWAVRRLMLRLGVSMVNSPVRFLLVLGITLVLSWGICALSGRKRFSFLKILCS